MEQRKLGRSSLTVVALAWLMRRSGIAAPIASATSVEPLQELMKAPSLKLDDDGVAALDGASA